MTDKLSFHDARRIVALLSQAPEGRIRLVDEDLSILAVIEGEAKAPETRDSSGIVTIFSPAVGVFHKSGDDNAIGIIRAPGRSIPVASEHDDEDIETLVEDGAFVEYGAPIATYRKNGSERRRQTSANGRDDETGPN